ncbi:MAG: 6-pyruvoyl-tetrahydropterin synthase-related protein [Acidobacteriaceae bacterium]
MRFWFQFPASASSDATRAQRRRSLLLAVVFIAVLPLAWRGTSCGQDFDFHLQNWQEVVAHWHHGAIYPHWAESANYLAGEPRFVFYPPLSWIVGGLLGVVLPWTWTPVAFTLLALLGAGFSFRAMARAWMPEDSATIAACLYVLNPYMLFVAYERGAMAELLAAMWVPLLVLYGLRTKRSLLPLALTVAAIWLTNAPAGVMGCYMLAVLVAVTAAQEKNWRLMGRAAAGVALGLGLAGFWLIPALYEQRWVEIARAIGPLMRVEDSFLFGYAQLAGVSADERFDVIYHNQVLRTVSWIVVVLIAGAVVAAWLARKKRNVIWMPLVVIGAAVSILQLRWTDGVWRLAPELKFLQFPWRWMMVLGLVLAALAGLALRGEAATRRAIAVRAALMLLLAGGMAVLSSLLFWQPCDDEDNVQAQIATFHEAGFEGTDEYTPQGADNGEIQQGLPQVRLLKSPNAEQASDGNNSQWTSDPSEEIAADVKVDRWNSERKSVTIVTAQPAYAVLRLMDYPAWRVTRNGAVVSERARRGDGLMAIPIAAGTNHIDVRWRTTGDQWAGIGISLAALAITLVLWLKGRRRIDGSGFR